MTSDSGSWTVVNHSFARAMVHGACFPGLYFTSIEITGLRGAHTYILSQGNDLNDEKGAKEVRTCKKMRGLLLLGNQVVRSSKSHSENPDDGLPTCSISELESLP